ncbi:MAG: LeuD/DmdB family oxidoreductase small subunit [Alphaproteobacteria bacterium]
MAQEHTPGKAWVFGDNVDTDLLAPGLYMKGSLEALAPHCLEAVDPDFSTEVREGDVLVGGVNFGVGSSREQAVQVLQYLGVRALIAQSFGGIFFRNALNFGLVAATCKQADRIRPGDRIAVSVESGTVQNITRNETYPCDSLPPLLLAMIADGGLVPHLEKKLARSRGPQ